MKRSIGSVIFGFVLALSLVGTAAAQEGIETQISVRAVPAPVPEVADSVAAILTQSDGTPIGGAEIEFRVQVELLGSRTAYLGRAMTGATGEARIPFVPRATSHTIEAKYAGDASVGLAPATGLGAVSFPPSRVVPMPAERPESQLATLRTVAPRVMGIVVAGLWLFFVLVTVSLVRDIRRPSRETEAAMT